MSSFWLGVGGVALFFTLIILLPIIMTVGGKKKASTPTAPAPPETTEAVARKKKLWFLGTLGLVGTIFFWFYPPWVLLDWSTTLPGKAIEQLLGQGWANWVLWALVAIILWMIIRNFLPQAKKASGGSSGFPVFLGLVLAVLLIAVLSMSVKTYIETPKPVYAPVDLRYIEVGKASEPVRMPPHGIAVVQTRLPPPNTGKNFWPCPKVVAPELPKKVKFEVVAGAHTTVNHIALVEQSKQDLLPYGGITLQVQFTLTESTPGISPCENLPAAK